MRDGTGESLERRGPFGLQQELEYAHQTVRSDQQIGDIPIMYCAVFVIPCQPVTKTFHSVTTSSG